MQVPLLCMYAQCMHMCMLVFEEILHDVDMHTLAGEVRDDSMKTRQRILEACF